MGNERLHRVTWTVVIGAAGFDLLLAVAEVFCSKLLRALGIAQSTVYGAFFLAIGVLIAALVCQQVNRGESYLQSGSGPVQRREHGCAFWFYIAVDAIIALAAAALGVWTMLGHSPPAG